MTRLKRRVKLMLSSNRLPLLKRFLSDPHPRPKPKAFVLNDDMFLILRGSIACSLRAISLFRLRYRVRDVAVLLEIRHCRTETIYNAGKWGKDVVNVKMELGKTMPLRDRKCKLSQTEGNTRGHYHSLYTTADPVNHTKDQQEDSKDLLSRTSHQLWMKLRVPSIEREMKSFQKSHRSNPINQDRQCYQGPSTTIASFEPRLVIGLAAAINIFMLRVTWHTGANGARPWRSSSGLNGEGDKHIRARFDLGGLGFVLLMSWISLGFALGPEYPILILLTPAPPTQRVRVRRKAELIPFAIRH